MNYLTTNIFTPGAKKNDWYNVIAWICWSVSLIILFTLILKWLKPTLLLMTLDAVMLITPFLFLYLLNHFILLPLNGSFEGRISFASDGLAINEKKIMLDNIVEVHIKVDDYYRKHEFRGRGDFRPCLSQGVSNCISLTIKDCKNFIIYFRLLDKYERRLLNPLIEKFVRERKMPLMEGMELLGIKKYSEIQSFKNHYSEQQHSNN